MDGWMQVPDFPTGNVRAASNIPGDCVIVVQPDSWIYDWVDGSPEDILESIRVVYKFQGYYTKSQMKADIKDFYKTFYGYTFTSDDLNNLLRTN